MIGLWELGFYQSPLEEVSSDVPLGAVSDEGPPTVVAKESFVDPVMAIKMKELDLRIKQEEHEMLLIKLRIIESETD